jgi:hypothetical protein
MLAVTGCGSGSGAGSVNAAQRSPLIAQADSICKQLNTEFAAHKPASDGLPEIARVSPDRAVLEQRTVRELAALTPPTSLAHDWQQIIGYRQTLAKELAELGRYAKTNDMVAVRRLEASKKVQHKKLFTVARRNGFTDCAQVG